MRGKDGKEWSSCLYRGSVIHRRFKPVGNVFKYKVLMFYLNLDEVPDIFENHGLYSGRRAALARFKRSDFHGDPEIPLKDAVRQTLETELGVRHQGPVYLLTNLRYFGYIINPVSFYYCYSPDGKEVEHIIAEITNTPWGERRSYILGRHMDKNTGPGKVKRYEFLKDFHVSPFMQMEMIYHWLFHPPGKRCNVYMKNINAGIRVFDAALVLERMPVTKRNLTGVLLKYPFMTLKVVAMIHWQALRLWFKRSPFYTHPFKTGIPGDGHTTGAGAPLTITDTKKRRTDDTF